MTETLALAVGIPLALGAICLASRRSRPLVTADARGIALQTVIVIVVMLVIAGGVSGVLLSRGGDVISDLESADVNATEINSRDECTSAARALTGDSNAVIGSGERTASWDINAQQCTVRGDGDDGTSSAQQLFGRTECEQFRDPDGNRGTFTPDGSNGATDYETCVI